MSRVSPWLIDRIAHMAEKWRGQRSRPATNAPDEATEYAATGHALDSALPANTAHRVTLRRRWLQRGISIGWVLITLLILWRYGTLSRDLTDLRASSMIWRTQLWWPAAAAYLIAQGIVMLNWHTIMARLSDQTTWRRDLGIYAPSFFLGGLPGGIWSIFGLMYGYQRIGVRRVLVLLAIAVENLTLLIASLLIAAIIVPWSLNIDAELRVPIAVAASLPLIGVASAPAVWRSALQLLTRVPGLESLSSLVIRSRDLWLSISLQALAMCASGLFLYFTINVVYQLPLAALPAVLSSWCLVTAVSVLAYFIPGSSGIVFSVALLTLGSLLPSPVVLAGLLLTRLGRLIGSGVWAGVTLLAGIIAAYVDQRY